VSSRVQWKDVSGEWRNAVREIGKFDSFDWRIPSGATDVRMVQVFQSGYFRRADDTAGRPEIYVHEDQPDGWDDGEWVRLELSWKDATGS
jgi:hypothetical protein